MSAVQSRPRLRLRLPEVQAKLKAALNTYMAHRTGAQRVLTAGFVVFCIYSAAGNLLGKYHKPGQETGSSKSRKRSRRKSTTNKTSVSDPVFQQNLKRLLRIVIPSLKSRESAMLLLHTVFLVARTALSLYVADLDGR